jgi:ubiquinone/menaquinone biosynthesis C-methylase UbiE
MTEQKPTITTRLMRAFMRTFFRLLYHPLAGFYDMVAGVVSVGRWKRWVLATAALVTGQRILELGFGPGHLQARMHADGLLAYGIDESRQMARQAGRRLDKMGSSRRLARGLAQNLPFVSTSFDCVVATFPTLYIVDPLTLRDVQRVLRPGGRLVVLMAAWITGRSPIDRLMAFIFRLTGEAPDENFELSEVLDPYTQAGFRASIRFVDQPGSRLMFIVATREKA